MVKIKEAIFDAGPFIHLNEIQKLTLCKLFSKIFTTEEILYECKNIKDIIIKLNNLRIENLDSKSKDFSKYLVENYDLDLGEATGIALCRQNNIKKFFTDDLQAKEISIALGFDSHGTLAILLRSYREKLVSKKDIINAVNSLYNNSSLFLTKDLLDYTLKEIEKFK